jgi:hypothetical protein
MKQLSLSILCVVVLTGCTSSDKAAPLHDASTAQEHAIETYAPSAERRSDVVAKVQQLFDALGTGDVELLRAIVDPTVVMHFTEARDGVTTFGNSTVDGLADRISADDPPLIERMWDPIVATNGSLAMLWAPYDFYTGATFSHCGVDAVNLMKTDDGWRIVGLSWTRLQPPECDLHPEGPPAAG